MVYVTMCMVCMYHDSRCVCMCVYRQLRVSGQRLGASVALCHLKRLDSNSKKFSLQIANVGDVEAVLCRQDDAVVLTRKFTTTDNREECYRVCLSDGIIMEVSL